MEAATDPLSLLWLFFILASLQPAVQRQRLEGQRRYRLKRLSDTRGGTVITLIHRQETMSLFGFPVVRYIDIDDAEGVLRAISETPTPPWARSTPSSGSTPRRRSWRPRNGRGSTTTRR